MNGETDLSILLKNINPILHDDEFVFISINEKEFSNYLQFNPILLFKEEEGITLILSLQTAEKNNLSYSSIFKMISLTINSSLNAIGFLALISSKFAEAEIPINVISAFYHDHLFIPVRKADKALKLLKEIQASNNG